MAEEILRPVPVESRKRPAPEPESSAHAIARRATLKIASRLYSEAKRRSCVWPIEELLDLRACLEAAKPVETIEREVRRELARQGSASLEIPMTRRELGLLLEVLEEAASDDPTDDSWPPRDASRRAKLSELREKINSATPSSIRYRLEEPSDGGASERAAEPTSAEIPPSEKRISVFD